ncbi:serine hydrolase [Merismopedia glauca]|uniref:Serine hydrolase n=1 Tax=Merismopedia glauca CCAP 1448/3 TaxID=1296344 RepID=A0A2T1BYH7_9CYAN|nr:serine hydrolase [Merismopedia glauca]PSB01052.1 serine hydrolase [Merismopedia glauca CCAP 1448/3]
MNFFRSDTTLEQLGNEILETTWEKFPNLARDRMAMTWVVYDPPIPVNTGGAITAGEFWRYSVRGFDYRGVERIYPASIVKLFYLVAAHEWLDKGMAATSAELERAMRDMIVNSSNDATSLVVDVLTGTTSGPELPSGPFETWQYLRNLINRYYQSLGWSEMANINVNQKTWGDGPYGREMEFVGKLRENRNMLSTNATARLLHAIVGGIAVSSQRSLSMMNLLKRSVKDTQTEEQQISGFLGEGLAANAQIWSKAGWTSQMRHDAAYIEIPNLLPYLLVVFTEGQSSPQQKQILPFISQQIAQAMISLS